MESKSIRSYKSNTNLKFIIYISRTAMLWLAHLREFRWDLGQNLHNSWRPLNLLSHVQCTFIYNAESQFSGYFLQQPGCDLNTLLYSTILYCSGKRETYGPVNYFAVLSYFVILNYMNSINWQNYPALVGTLIKTHKLAHAFDSSYEDCIRFF